MSLYNAPYPNLELMEYQAREILMRDEEWKKKVKKVREMNKHLHPSFDINVFSQIWGSTNAAFDVCPDGSPTAGGSAMTKAYTVVMKETLTDTFIVFVDGRPCYKVENPTDEFYRDLAEHDMKSLSVAMARY